MEFSLAKALQAGGSRTSVIGSDAGENLKRLASSVYWSALDNLGIRKTKGSPEAYLGYGPSDLAQMKFVLWHPSLPQSPRDFLKNTSFELTSNEDAFLKDRMETLADLMAALLAPQLKKSVTIRNPVPTQTTTVEASA